MSVVATTGLILAAGEGNRLKRSWPNTPKPLVPVGGEPLIGRLLRCLDKAELESIVVVSRSTDPVVGRYVRGLSLCTPIAITECITPGALQSLIEGLARVHTDRILLALADTVFPEVELARFQASARLFETHQATGVQWVRSRLPDDRGGEQGVQVLSSGLITGVGRHLISTPVISQGVSLYDRSVFELAFEAATNGLTGLSEFLPFVVRKDGMALYAHHGDRIHDVDDELDRCIAEQEYC